MTTEDTGYLDLNLNDSWDPVAPSSCTLDLISTRVRLSKTRVDAFNHRGIIDQKACGRAQALLSL